MIHLSTFRASAAVLSFLFAGHLATAATHPGTERPAAQHGRAAAPVAKTLSDCCGEVVPATDRKTPQPAAKQPATAVASAAALPAIAPAAPQLVQLTGIVLNPDGRPCAGASVYPAGAPRQLVVTDAKGAFVLPVPASGAVSLRVEYFGVGTSRVEVPKPGAEPVRVTLGQ